MSQRANPIKLPAASEDSKKNSSPPAWHAEFLKMLPKITEHASFSFRHLKGDSRDEMIQEVVTNALKAFVRLVEQGRSEAATWSSLARYAVRQVRDGRQVGSSLNVRDVSSRHCQKRKGVNVRSLSCWDDQDQEWKELIVEDRRSTPADVAAFRVDFREFHPIALWPKPEVGPSTGQRPCHELDCSQIQDFRRPRFPTSP